MYYGTIEKTAHGIRIKIDNLPGMLFVGYSLKQSIKKYREKYELQYKKIRFIKI